MPTQYNAIAETTTPLAAGAEQLLDALADYHPGVGRSPFGRTEVTITVPADTVRQAVSTALAVLTGAVGPHLLLSLEVLETADFDRRNRLAPVPDLVSVTEAAEELGISRQAVLQRIESGSLPATKIGTSWAVPQVALRGIGAEVVAERAALKASMDECTAATEAARVVPRSKSKP